MPNIQVIDAADNCTYDIYEVGLRDFDAIFPNGQDIEFADDLEKRVGRRRLKAIFSRIWAVRVDKKNARGVHGTLFFDLPLKKKYYPTKKEVEMVSAV